MADLKRLGTTRETPDDIEDAEFVELDGTDQPWTKSQRHAQPPKSNAPTADRPFLQRLLEAAWAGTKTTFLAILALLAFLAFIRLVINPAGTQPSRSTSDSAAMTPPDDGASQETLSPSADNAAVAGQPADLASYIDHNLQPGEKFEIDSDGKAPAGANHRCNRGATYEYFFNETGPGTYLSWFSDPQAPSMTIGETGTYRFEGGRLYLKAQRANAVIRKRDGSVRSIEAPPEDLPPEKNAQILSRPDGLLALGGVLFRRCNGYA